MYRLRYRNGDCEIEVESSEREYTDQKFSELLSTVRNAQPSSRRPAVPDGVSKPPADTPGDFNASEIAERIHESEDYPRLDSQVLRPTARLPKIMMCFYYGSECGHPVMSAAEVEAITDELGAKILGTNVTKTIKQERSFFTVEQGSPTRYKLNRRGRDEFEKNLRG